MEAIGSATGRYDVYVLRDPDCTGVWTQLDAVHVGTRPRGVQGCQVGRVFTGTGSVDHRGADGGDVCDGEGSIEGKIAVTVSDEWRVAGVGAADPHRPLEVCSTLGGIVRVPSYPDYSL